MARKECRTAARRAANTHTPRPDQAKAGPVDPSGRRGSPSDCERWSYSEGGAQPMSKVLRIAWAANFGDAAIRNVSTPALSRVTTWDSTVGSDTWWEPSLTTTPTLFGPSPAPPRRAGIQQVDENVRGANLTLHAAI